jgi:tRNA 2-thiouridine synthesizing protein A
MTYDLLVDATGLVCPEPVMLLHRAVHEIEPGKVIKVLATDPSTKRDIPRFCQFLGHQLIDQQTDVDLFQYFIRRG